MTTSIFPADQTKPFVADNGVTYVYEADRWRVKAYKLDESKLEGYVEKTGDDVSGTLTWNNAKDEANEIPYVGIRVCENRKRGNKQILWAESGGSYTDGKLVTDIEPTVEASITNKKYVDAQIAEAMLDGTVDLTGYATKTYSDGEDVKLQNQIDELATQRGAVREYTIKGVSIGLASRDGELYLSSDEATTLNAISIGIRDNNGNETPPVEAGDVVDIEVDGVINRYIVASGNIQALSLTYQSGASTFAVDNVVNLYVYPQNSSTASKEYVDAQDNALKGYVDYQLGETNDKVGEELEALKEYVDTEIDNLPDSDPVPLDDFMSLAGTQLVTPGNWRIQQAASGGGTYSYISVDTDELKLYHLQEPTQSHHAATKAYVDAKPSGGSGFGISASRPPGLRFNVSIVNLPDGYFNWWTNNSTNNQHLELATTDRDGIAWGTNTLREDVKYNDKIPFTIWEVSDGAWKMKVNGTISRIDFLPDHALCYVSSNTALNGGNFVNGAGPYYITISGLF